MLIVRIFEKEEEGVPMLFDIWYFSQDGCRVYRIVYNWICTSTNVAVVCKSLHAHACCLKSSARARPRYREVSAMRWSVDSIDSSLASSSTQAYTCDICMRSACIIASFFSAASLQHIADHIAYQPLYISIQFFLES